MSRFSALVRRILGNTGPILAAIAKDVFPVVLKELGSLPMASDDDRRAIAEEIVKDLIDKKYPEYAWLADRAVEFVFNSARMALQKRR